MNPQWPIGTRSTRDSPAGSGSNGNRSHPRSTEGDTPLPAGPPSDDIAPAAAALWDFLLALGVPPDDPELQQTPERAARAMRDELLDGYRVSAREVLSDALPTQERGLVAITRIRYASVCPHHVLPCEGTADVGYLPGGRIVGLGTLVRLVNALAHRLVLQETLGRNLADALVDHLDARAAGAVLQARHCCLADRGERLPDARVVTQSFAGLWASDVSARAEFLHAVAKGAVHE